MDIECISAVTFVTQDMGQSVEFYRTLGFQLLCGGEDTRFTSFRAGSSYLNLAVLSVAMGMKPRRRPDRRKGSSRNPRPGKASTHPMIPWIPSPSAPRNVRRFIRSFYLSQPQASRPS